VLFRLVAKLRDHAPLVLSGKPCRRRTPGPHDAVAPVGKLAQLVGRQIPETHALGSRHNRKLAYLKARLRELAEEVLSGAVDRGDAAIVGQLLNTVIRAIATELKVREQTELLERLEALEEALESRKGEHRWGA
jgi:hypothetical protein